MPYRYAIKDETSANIQYAESRSKVTNAIVLPSGVILNKIGRKNKVNFSLPTP
jgi:hypothetical protein